MVRRDRWLPIAVSVILFGATASPVLKHPNQDGFPLSTYPMFGWKRSTTITMEYIVGFTATGERWHPPPRAVGTGEPMQAKRILENARRGGKERQLALCKAAAARMPRMRGGKDIVLMTMMTGTHEAVQYLIYDTPGRETELVRCPVPGREQEAAALPVALSYSAKQAKGQVTKPPRPPPALAPGPAVPESSAPEPEVNQ